MNEKTTINENSTINNIKLKGRSQNLDKNNKSLQLIVLIVAVWVLLVFMVIVLCGIGFLKLSGDIIGLLKSITFTMCTFFSFVVKCLFKK